MGQHAQISRNSRVSPGPQESKYCAESDGLTASQKKISSVNLQLSLIVRRDDHPVHHVFLILGQSNSHGVKDHVKDHVKMMPQIGVPERDFSRGIAVPRCVAPSPFRHMSAQSLIPVRTTNPEPVSS
jgi:hypothetical protein